MEFLKKLIIKIFPDIVYDREESLKAIKSLNQKLQNQKEETKEWRDRALGTEHFLRKLSSDASKLAQEFDDSEGTNIWMQLR